MVMFEWTGSLELMKEVPLVSSIYLGPGNVLMYDADRTLKQTRSLLQQDVTAGASTRTCPHPLVDKVRG